MNTVSVTGVVATPCSGDHDGPENHQDASGENQQRGAAGDRPGGCTQARETKGQQQAVPKAADDHRHRGAGG